MATTTTKRPKRSTSAKTKKESLISPQRWREIFGILVMVVALLMAIATVTYHGADQKLVRSFTFDTALHPEQKSLNSLGSIGAILADMLVFRFLGYPVLILIGLLGTWGYAIVRGRTPRALPFISVLLTLGAFLLASLAGWVQHFVETEANAWSGLIGFGFAGWLESVLGSIGAIIILGTTSICVALLMIDHDIQRTFDRLEDVVRRIGPAFAEWREEMQEAREVRREERERRREEEIPRMQREREAARAKTAQPSIPTRIAPIYDTPAPEPRPAPEEQPVPKSTLPFPVHTPPATPRPEPSFVPEMKVQERFEERPVNAIAPKSGTPLSKYIPPSLDLLDPSDPHGKQLDFVELEENKQILLDKLAMYNIEITSINAIVGPTVTMYELTPAPGVKISRITALEDDLAMAMAARGIRMIAPIPGKSAIGVEIPNRHRELVRIRDIIGTARFQDTHLELPAILGKSIEGEVCLEDLTKCPHLLIAGATGSGKSVGLNTLIAGLLYACPPEDLKFVMIDPKKIELSQYARISEHYIAMPPFSDDPIITDFTMALGVLKSCEKEMERRYDLLSKAMVRGIKDYNKKVNSGQLPEDEGHVHLPYIVVVVDELADLMMTAGKDIEGPIARLAQMARAVGIHLVLATQRPSVDVITGLIKANFPSRIAYQVASKVDSRTILDQNGAEQLVGNGDLLYMNGSRLLRLQCPFVSVDEIDRLTKHIDQQGGPGPYELPSIEETSFEVTTGNAGNIDDIDEFFADAARIIVRAQQGSVSLLQRKLSVGYSRAARIVDQLEEAGIVGPFEGSKARRVLLESEEELDALLNQARDEA